jgi:hypothetical protein
MLGKQKRMAMYLLNTRNFTPVKPTPAQYAIYNTAVQNMPYLNPANGNSKLVCVIQGYYVMHHTWYGTSYYAICKMYKNGSYTRITLCSHYITIVQHTIANAIATNAKNRGTKQAKWVAGFNYHMYTQYGIGV